MTPEAVKSKAALTSKLRDVLPFGKYFSFLVTKKEKLESHPNALQLLIANSLQLKLPPAKAGSLNGKDKMFNSLRMILQERKLGWQGFSDTGPQFMSAVVDLLWKVSDSLMISYNFMEFCW